jgi:predicted extracellular nuclease
MNIEHLGGGSTGQRPKAIAEHIFLASPDILVMSEIYDNDQDDDTRTNEELNTAFALLNQNDLYDWDYVLLPNKDEDDESQLCAVAWNKKRISKVGDPLRIDVTVSNDPHNCWDRHPHAVKLSRGNGKSDIVVIPLHMKANPGVGQDNSDELEQREHEAELLVNQLDEVRDHFDDDDVVILGDTNALRTDEDCIQEFVAAGYEDLNERDTGTFKSSAPFDRVLVPRGPESEEFVFSRQYILRSADPAEHEQFISDHSMIVIPVRVLNDDD